VKEEKKKRKALRGTKDRIAATMIVPLSLHASSAHHPPDFPVLSVLPGPCCIVVQVELRLRARILHCAKAYESRHGREYTFVHKRRMDSVDLFPSTVQVVPIATRLFLSAIESSISIYACGVCVYVYICIYIYTYMHMNMKIHVLA